jgi:deoxyribonuclease V
VSVFAAVDVDYRASETVAAAVVFAAWDDPAPTIEQTVRLARAAPYRPGAFWLRELPGLLAVIAALPVVPTCVLVDAYVWLPPDAKPGLGARLHDALGHGTAIVGIAKNPLAGDALAIPVLRGASKRPLFVTAAGLDAADAAAGVRRMHGVYRVPTLLRRVDRLGRDA